MPDTYVKLEGAWAAKYHSAPYVCYPTYPQNNIMSYDTATTINATNNFVYQYQYFYPQVYGTGNITCGNVDWQTAAIAMISYGNINFIREPETDEKRLVREQNERDHLAKEEARKKRAREALLAILNDRQREQFEKDSHFELEVNGNIYRVRPGNRVVRLDPQTQKPESFFCIHPGFQYDLPNDDVAISQKLWLEANEAEFLRVANRTSA